MSMIFLKKEKKTFTESAVLRINLQKCIIFFLGNKENIDYENEGIIKMNYWFDNAKNSIPS